MHEVQGQQPYGDVELAYAQRPHTVCSRASMYTMSTGSSLKTSGLPRFLITSMPYCHSSQRAIRPKVMCVDLETPMKPSFLLVTSGPPASCGSSCCHLVELSTARP